MRQIIDGRAYDIPVPGTPLPWATGSYRATETFRTVEWHEAIMQDNGAEEAQGLLIAACGAAHDPQTIQDVEYIVEAANSYPALMAQRDALLEAAQALVENPRPSAFARNRLRTAIAAVTGEKE